VSNLDRIKNIHREGRKMRRNISVFVSVLVLMGVLLSACAPAATAIPATAPAQPTTENSAPATAVVPPTVVPTAAPTAVPTLTPGSVQINGAGATFPQPVYAEWTYAYQYVDPSVTINYQGIGSGGGKNAIIGGTVDFAGSDSLLSDDEYTKGKDLQMYPALAGAAVLIYNVEGLKAGDPAIVLDRNTVVGIFNGKIKTWNDPAILATNDALKSKLPAKQITVVHRSDGSGTTEMFTKALTAFSPDWKAGGAQSVEWPVDKAGNGIGAKGNPGVAAAVQNTPDSIGYVELDYAVANSISYTQLINKAGKTVTANSASVQSAMADFADKFTDKLTNTIVDGAGDGSWPISGYTYYILHTTSMTDPVKAQKLLEYIQWTLTDPAASKKASDLGYSVLSADVQKMVLAKLAEVTVNGKPVLTK
jgi:phosphate transport system substrate-binding protein